MKRYIRVYIRLLKLNASAMFAYRANFVNSIVSSIGWAVVSISAIFLLTSHSSSVFGWSREELFLLVGIYNILNGIFVAFLARNFERFSRMVSYAQLDSILIKPIDSQFLVSLSLFNVSGIARIIIGTLFTAYIISMLGIHMSIIVFLEFLFFLFLSTIIFYSVWVLVLIPVMWFVNLTNLVDFLYVINNFARYPSEMITSAHNVLLLVFIPLTLMASIPARALLSNLTIQSFILYLVITGGLFFLSRKFYFFALRSYTSASS